MATDRVTVTVVGRDGSTIAVPFDIPIAGGAQLSNPRIYPFKPESWTKMPIGSNADFDPEGFWPLGGTRDTFFAEVMVVPSQGGLIDVYVYNKSYVDANGVRAWDVFGTNDPNPVKQAFQLQCDPAFATLKATPSGSTQGNPNSAGALLKPDGRTLQNGNYFFIRPDANHPYALIGDKLRGTLDIFGDGLEYARKSAAWGGHGGSMLGGIPIMLGELFSDPVTDPIRHVLMINAWMKGIGTRAADGTNAYQWPAFQADKPGQPGTYGTAASVLPGCVSKLPMGALVAIPPNVTLTQSMFETVAGFKVAQAAQRFGIVMVDEVGSASWISNGLAMAWGCVEEGNAHGVNLGGRQNGPYPNPWSRDMDKILSLCRWVRNNGPASIGGGGTPLYQMAPPLAA